MLSFVEDTTKGAHDTLVSACDAGRYKALGVQEYHPSCKDNYNDALKAAGKDGLFPSTPPAPLNLFMNVPVGDEGKISFQVPSSEAGQYVCLKAGMDLLIIMSACPMDLRATNNWNPSEVHYVVLDAM